MFELWGDPETRRRVEEDAARWAGLDDRWQVLLWVPPPEMRLKPADVLVDGGRGVMTFFEYEHRGRGRGDDIYEAHRALWSVGVHVDPAVALDEQLQRRVIARIAEQMNITFTQYEGEFGNQAYLWPDKLAASTIISDALGPEEVPRRPELAKDLIERVRTQQVAARGAGDDDSWVALVANYRGASADFPELNPAD